MKCHRTFKYFTIGKISLMCTTGGLAAINVPQQSLDIHSFSKGIKTDIDGACGRSFRALTVIIINVIDYKYSLQCHPTDSCDYHRKLSEVHLRSAQRILKLCETNKGFYVKAGQFVASARQIPKEYSETLSSLQDKVVPCQFEYVKGVLMNNFGKDLSEIFLSFNERPIAAASIAQVHHAILTNNQEVAVKVQYPGLKQQMKKDIATMTFLSGFVTWIFPEYRFGWLLSEFKKAVSQELDFVQEAKNAERTSRNFQKKNVVKIPRIYWEFTTNQVLTMEFCMGQKVDDVKFLREKNIHPTKVAKVLLEVFAEMIFVHGFLHGDPHPGNILVSPGGPAGFSLVILDHGIYSELEEHFRLNYCKLWKALVFLDAKNIESLGEQFGVGKYSRYFPIIFLRRTFESKFALSRAVSMEEKKSIKHELGSLTMGDISFFMESLPQDFLMILRTDNLLRSIVGKLGVSPHARLLANAKYAIYGLSIKMILESGSNITNALFSLKTKLSYVLLRAHLLMLEFLAWMDDFRRMFIDNLKFHGFSFY